MKENDLRVTIRLLPEKKQVYQDFKQNVIEVYHSDICYVMTSLMEAFNAATNQKPNADTVTMKFIKQNVQINIGCNFNYNVKKARRIQHETELNVNKNIFFPKLIEDWQTMTDKNKTFWLQRLQEEGIIQPQKKFQQTQPRDKSHTLLHAVKKFASWVRGKFHRK